MMKPRSRRSFLQASGAWALGVRVVGAEAWRELDLSALLAA